VVVLADSVHGDEAAMVTTLRSIAGLSAITSASDFTDGAVNMQQADEADAALLPALGLAIVSGQPDRLASLTAAASKDPRIAAIEPERTVYPLTRPGMLAAEYLRGYRDAAAALYQHANGHDLTTMVPTAAEFKDTPEFTWGLQATKVATSPYDGRGVSVAMLDSGLDLTHPDFAGRNITSVSFVSNETPEETGLRRI
jgi:subtilisin family serine protease